MKIKSLLIILVLFCFSSCNYDYKDDITVINICGKEEFTAVYNKGRYFPLINDKEVVSINDGYIFHYKYDENRYVACSNRFPTYIKQHGDDLILYDYSTIVGPSNASSYYLYTVILMGEQNFVFSDLEGLNQHLGTAYTNEDFDKDFHYWYDYMMETHCLPWLE